MARAERFVRWGVVITSSVALVAAVMWWREERPPGVNSALIMVDQVNIDGFTRLTSGVVSDNPPTVYAQYIGDTDDHVFDRVHAPGVRIIARSDPPRDLPPDSIVIAVGNAPDGCALKLERFLPTAAPYARRGVDPAQAANLENGTQMKLELMILCLG